jgi:Leu/Phe-tRNA-protein transferase
MVDCGSLKPHLATFGAQEIPREQFVEMVVHGLAQDEVKTPAQHAVAVAGYSDPPDLSA